MEEIRVTPAVPEQLERNAPLIGHEAHKLSQEYGIPEEYHGDIQCLIESGVLGEEAKQAGWHNVGVHCIQSFRQAQIQSYLLGFDADRAQSFNSIVLKHDAPLRIRKGEYAQKTCTAAAAGITRVDVGNNYYLDHELRQQGIMKATGMDWRDFESYTPEQLAMRYIDSTTGPVRSPHGVYGYDAMQHWTERVASLHDRKPEISMKIGHDYYQGTPAFGFLWQIMPYIESRLYHQAREAHPELFTDGKYEDTTKYFNLLQDLYEAQYQENPRIPLM